MEGSIFWQLVGELSPRQAGTFRLVPPPTRLPALRRDYQSMRDMYLSQPPGFDEVIAVLADLEQRINGIVGR